MMHCLLCFGRNAFDSKGCTTAELEYVYVAMHELRS
jgi:hypothetical protein